MTIFRNFLVAFTIAANLSFIRVEASGRNSFGFGWSGNHGRRFPIHNSPAAKFNGGGGIIPSPSPSFPVINKSPILNSPRTDPNSYPIVQIRDGGLRGFTMRTATSRPIHAFLGIPFAQPPVGNLRFRDPIRNLPWNGTRDAIAQSPQCLQLDLMRNMEVHGQEDCLYLNVYRPANISSQKLKSLPVMVWIHGGGFFFGSGTIYGPAYLLDQDIILVTLNYRLGPFGFFSTGDDASPGNQGLKDQVLALRWVQENIGAFGGDINSVTIVGESAGAGAVHHQIVSPLSRGLFHRAISESGSGMCFWSIIEAPENSRHIRRVGELLNCTGTSQQMINCLREVDASRLAPIQLQLTDWNLFPIVIFGPVVEHRHAGAFLVEIPEEAYKNNRVPRIPWITGFNRDELVWLVSAMIQDTNAVADLNNDWDRVGPIFLALKENSTASNIQAARQIRQFYMGNEDLTFETRHQFSRMFTDRFLTECSMEAMRYHSRFTGAPTYAYRFTYEGRFSIVENYGQNPRDWGVAHLDELIYLFNNTDYYQTLQPSDPEFEMSRMMTNIWSNFATFGRPYIQAGKQLQNIWQPLQGIENKFSPVQFLELNLTPRMTEDPYVERYNFWRRLALAD